MVYPYIERLHSIVITFIARVSIFLLSWKGNDCRRNSLSNQNNLYHEDH